MSRPCASVIVGLMVLVLSCGHGPRWETASSLPSGWRRPPASGDEPLAIPPVLERAARELLHEIEGASARGDRDSMARLVGLPAITTAWETAREPIAVEAWLLGPAVDGVIADLRVRYRDGRRPTSHLSVFLGPGEDGRWKLQQLASVRASERLKITRTTMTLVLWRDQQRLAGDGEVLVETGGATVIPFLFDLSYEPHARLVVTQDGVPCRTAILKGRVLVALARPAGTVHLRFQYEWLPSPAASGYISDDTAILTGAFPILPGSRGETTITFVHDPELIVIGNGERREEPAVAGWARTTLHEPAAGILAAARRGATIRRLTVGKVQVHLVLGASAASAEEAKAREDNIRSALEGLPIEYPHDALWVFERDDEGSTAWSWRNMLLLRQGFDRVGTTTHELMHAWTPSIVPSSVEANRQSEWDESLPEWIATFVEPELAERAWTWYQRHAGKAEDLALLDPRVHALSMEARQVLNYAKGTLALLTLEADVGRPTMLAIVRRLITRRNVPTRWLDVVDIVREAAGDAPARRLHGWLTLPGAPQLGLSRVTVSAGHIRGFVTQTGHPLETAVEIGVVGEPVDDDEPPILARARLIAAGAETPFDIPLTAGAVSLRLDPDHRLPQTPSPGWLDTQEIWLD
jgi:hypothetical protein